MSAINGINGHGTNANEMNWKVGLLNSAKKYLTAESFGFKINASGTSLRKKQTWTLTVENEPDAPEIVVFIRSHMGRYLSTDKSGKLTCDCQEPGPTEKFIVEYASDGSGKWLFRNMVHGYYVGGADDKIQCHAKNPGATEYWIPQLSIHPQVNLNSVNRRRYARLHEDQIQFTEVIPWGLEAMFLLDFYENKGKYALKTSDSRYLNREGELVDEPSDETMFTLELTKSGHSSGLAFKDNTGRYLTAVAHTATMKARNKTVSKDELFNIVDSHPQVILTASNGKKASIKQGVDVSANADEEDTDKETFQMEYDKTSGCWSFRTVNNKYWSLEDRGIQAIKSEPCKTTLFDVEWKGDGSISLKASNGKYVYNKPTGTLTAASDSVGEKEIFRLKVVNRSMMILRGEHGFIGFKTANAAKPEYVCNKSTYDIIYTEVNEDGTYHFKGQNGKYWSVATDGSLYADSDNPTPLLIEMRGLSIVTVKAPNGNYLKGEQNGLFRALGKEINNACTWEF